MSGYIIRQEVAVIRRVKGLALVFLISLMLLQPSCDGGGGGGDSSESGKYILFAHGMFSSKEDWDAFALYAENLGGYHVYRTDVGPCDSIKDRASALADYINSLSDVPDASLTAVGHSMGGLDLRYIIGRAREGDSRFKAAARKIKTVYTIGTPHAGANPATVAGIIGFCDPATDDLTPEAMQAFNSEYTYDKFSVDGRRIGFLSYRFYCPICLFGGSDCVVESSDQTWAGAPSADSPIEGLHIRPVSNTFVLSGCTWELWNTNVLLKGILLGRDLSGTTPVVSDFEAVTSGGSGDKHKIWALSNDGKIWRFDLPTLDWKPLDAGARPGERSSAPVFADISAGGQEGNALWALDSDGTVWRLDNASNHWDKISGDEGVYFLDVSASGTDSSSAWAVGSDGKAYEYLNGEWRPVTVSDTQAPVLRRISVGGTTSPVVWAVDASGALWRYNSSGLWEGVAMDHESIDVSVSYDGSTVLAINDTVYAYLYQSHDWRNLEMPFVGGTSGSTGVDGSITVITDSFGRVWTYEIRDDKSLWLRLPDGRGL